MLTLGGCQCERREQAPPIRLTIIRADSLLFAPDGVKRFVASHGDFAELWAMLTGFRREEVSPEQWLERFSQDSLMRAVEDSIQQHFPDLTSTNEALTDALSRLHTKMPAIQIPRIYYFNSGFNASILAGDSLLGIGLDRFLGGGNHYYALLGIPQYIQRSMGPEWIVSTTLLQYLEADYPLSPTDATLLNTIIDQGKKYYIVQASTPGQPDTLTLPFTQAQLEWLSKYEKSVWEYLSEHKLLYSTNSRTLSQFTRSAPFTAALGQDSPGQAATYIGIQIVRRYMARNPSTAWAQLLSETTAQEILQGARYNPR